MQVKVKTREEISRENDVANPQTFYRQDRRGHRIRWHEEHWATCGKWFEGVRRMPTCTDVIVIDPYGEFLEEWLSEVVE